MKVVLAGLARPDLDHPALRRFCCLAWMTQCRTAAAWKLSCLLAVQAHTGATDAASADQSCLHLADSMFASPILSVLVAFWDRLRVS